MHRLLSVSQAPSTTAWPRLETCGMQNTCSCKGLLQSIMRR